MIHFNTLIKKLSFRFELSWLNRADFIPLVQKIWLEPCHAESTFDKIQKIQNYSNSISKVGDSISRGEMRKLKRKLQDKLMYLKLLEEDGDLTSKQTLKKIELQVRSSKV